jgi:hypothetical protein
LLDKGGFVDDTRRGRERPLAMEVESVRINAAGYEVALGLVADVFERALDAILDIPNKAGTE